ncbi:zinc finger protein SHOOT GRAVITROPISM 5-like [Punica granatum]|uniref:C2H2-type domain-containing protein n=2 Tax=Punica granatum TaxID=22663 RepID=A0A218VRL2_PUNGR|nr:zinc finger protein SHOOT GRAVITROPISM 5-like [Punica granatum]OWM62661.1 hypothetical protein CDL15_Pgr019955 [Punica granatum]PKI53490.1 hypothetical protein CRG98_026180 [Punica granatum]
MLVNTSPSPLHPSDPFSNCLDFNGTINKRKRRPAGTPDPDAEVVSLSPKTLLESDQYVCEICNQGFQRDQNLQMHRRRHKVPWKLLKRETPVARKRVFVCPEPSCLHHNPCHALGDLVGIKKHFRRKHSNHKQWVCEKCSKGYAVQSDYKAHIKTCGTRGHSCDCGRVFSRVESFIEHQDACSMSRLRADDSQGLQPACLSQTASSPSPSSDTNLSTTPRPGSRLNCYMLNPCNKDESCPSPPDIIILGTPLSRNSNSDPEFQHYHNLELQLSIGSSSDTRPKRNQGFHANFPENEKNDNANKSYNSMKHEMVGLPDVLRLALAEKAYAEDARRESRREVEEAEREFASARRMRQQAQAELDRARAMKESARKQIDSAILMITCHACKQQFLQGRDCHHDHRALGMAIDGINSSSAITEGDRCL